MNREDLYNGVTEVRDDLVEAAVPGKRRRPLWIPLAAAAAAIAVAVTALWPGGGGGKASPYLLAAAAYPEQAPRPISENYYQPNGDFDHERYSAASDAYWQDQEYRMDSLEGCQGQLNGFFSRAMAPLLSGGGEENRICSPVSFYLALSMLAETTGGNSREQILDLLGIGDIEALRDMAVRVFHGIYQDDGVTAVIPANSLWMNRDIPFVQPTVDILARDYCASSFRGEMGSAAFDQALRDWINRQTGGLLQEQSAGLSMPPETVLALANTLYFRDTWVNQFPVENTAPDLFHAPGGDVTADFMHDTVNTYVWGDHFSAVPKGFSGMGTMWFFLPEEGASPEDLLGDPQVMDVLLNGVDYGKEGENWKISTVNLSLPKFDAASDMDLREKLAALGVTGVLDPGISDFSPLTEDISGIYLSQAQHTARVTVDEEGCEAAAFTVMADAGMGGPMDDEEIDFTLDRPFLFAVSSSAGHLPLFVGIVNQP